jgi:hypothetical protein
MYTNRIRHDDFLNIFSKYCRDILDVSIEIDDEIKNFLNHTQLNYRFRGKDIKTLSIVNSWVVSNVKKY